MTTDGAARRASTVRHVRCRTGCRRRGSGRSWSCCRTVAGGAGPPRTAALVELKGALRYYGTDTRRLGEILHVRVLSRLGFNVRVSFGPSITAAATASAQVPQPAVSRPSTSARSVRG
ncbi:hypothetical protein [Streptomyces chartreusis]|uniref:hypothetical protein n=1 Tax=Streptomyces chartreusis TaxID=1969 RepID=UPI0037B54058